MSEALGSKHPWDCRRPLATLLMRWNEHYVLTTWDGRVRYAVAVWEDGTLTYERLPDGEVTTDGEMRGVQRSRMVSVEEHADGTDTTFHL